MTDRILNEIFDKIESYNYVQRLLEGEIQTSDRIDGLIRIRDLRELHSQIGLLQDT